MTFLFPLAFALTALLPAVVLLYLRRPRRVTREVSSLLFWRKVLERSAQHKFLGKLRNPLSLLLALLILALLILALAKPEWLRPQGLRSTVVVLDLRARMQAGDAFARAVTTAREIAAGADAREEVAILGVAGSPQLISSFSSDPRGLEEALMKVTPIDGGGSLPEALTLAHQLIQSRAEPRRIVVVSDRPLPMEDAAEVVLTGKAEDNAAILALTPRTIPASPQSVEVLLTVANYSATPKEIEVELSLDDQPFEITKQALVAGEEKDVIFELSAEMLERSMGRLTAKILKPDSLMTDNLARAVVPAGQPKRVLLVTESSPFLESALRANRALSLEILKPAEWKPALATGFDVVVWDAAWPGDQLPEQGNFFFFRDSPFDADEAEIPTDAVRAGARQSPLLWNVQWEDIRWPAARKLTLPAGAEWQSETVLENAEEPLLVALEKKDGQRLVAGGLTFEESGFGTRAGFPLFVSNVLAWLTHEQEVHTSLRAGETDLATATRMNRNGFYNGDQLAVNTFSAEESDLRAGKTTSSASANFGLPVFRLWQWLALATLALLLMEWATYHRRLTE